MKKAQIKFFLFAILALAISLAANVSSSKAGVKTTKLTIINHTDSQIDAIYISDSDDILPQVEEILMPKETISIDFDKYTNSANKTYQVKLVFADGQQFITEETIFDDSMAWEIKKDGNHKN